MASSTPRTSVDKDHVVPELAPTTSSPHSLSKAVHARRAEYTRPQKIRIKIGTWNVAACPGTEKDLGGWFMDGKGIDKRLAGMKIADGISKDKSQIHVESVGAQEERWTKKDSSIPKDDEGTIVGGEEIGIFVLGLQEVVDLNSATQYIGRVYTDPEPTAKWRKAMMDGLPLGYVMMAEQQLSGLLLFIFASPTVAPTISSVSTVSVGTGVMGYLGNKGAVASRIVLGETTRMVFVNSHLASGADPAHMDRRCWDVTQILQRTRFDPISWSGVLDDKHESIGDEDFAFWFGDLNFRLDGLPGDDIRRLLMLHTKGDYDIGQKSRNKIDLELGRDGPIIIKSVDSDSDSENEMIPKPSSTCSEDNSSSSALPDPDDFVQDPSQDPASLQATLDSLLPHDQLMQARKKRKAFHDGWREGPITFLPTYKYDVGSMGMFDSSEKRRAPSWCDRILYRTRRDKLEYDGKSQEEEIARLKDAEMKARGIDHAADDEDVLFDYNPDEDGGEEPTSNQYDEYDEGEENDSGAVITKEGYLDRIRQDVYTSHQRVLSSDHKPLDAVFTLEYDAVVPELKAKVQQEVARELDRAENETRPGITVVVDHSADDAPQPDEDSAAAVEGVDFGEVAYEQRKIRNVTIANTSQVSATFSFVDRPGEPGEEDRIAPSWLSVSVEGSSADGDEAAMKNQKKEVTLQPGDAVNATLELCIADITLVKTLNKGLQLDDVLVLRVTDGRDHFIPIRGTWLQSCFARSIDELIRVPEGGVRALRPLRKGGAPINRGQEVCWSAPRELFKLTEAIEILTDRAVADANMLDDAQPPADFPGWPFDAKSWTIKDSSVRQTRRSPVLNALDSDLNLIDSLPPEIPAIEKLEILSEILIMFFNSLVDGIVPDTLWTQIDQELSTRKQATSIEATKSSVLNILSTSPNHNISFVFFTSMLCRVASELSPVPKHSWRDSLTGSARSSMDTVRRSLSWKGKSPIAPPDPAVLRRRAVEKAYVDVFADVVFRGMGGTKEKERRREVLEAFLEGGRA
ncbi:related to inositol polyphosphate 5-phosphatase ocrl-1 [Rhynchosporium secalis]|uniref:Related to inositol polyphosphate 5-phosphatase ocrl-1 n=1 Tax=Rhynchosporium secalis TaxID=38038 RepID=A0A1E1MKX8_RHYSE|nr:related to inositol polyphosphate 5-phosphatase ocrl-1 [Rhynchosporium secalis]